MIEVAIPVGRQVRRTWLCPVDRAEQMNMQQIKMERCPVHLAAHGREQTLLADEKTNMLMAWVLMKIIVGICTHTIISPQHKRREKWAAAIFQAIQITLATLAKPGLVTTTMIVTHTSP